MKKRYLIFPLIIIILAIGAYFSYPYLKPLKIDMAFKNYNETEYSKGVRCFITDHLSRDSGGVYTNYLDKENEGDETKGHYILSESQGLLMEYALMINDEKLFDESYKVVKDNMMLDNGLVSWRISKNNEKNPTSALIDELRIARCLIEGYLKFDKFDYKVGAVNLSKAVLENSTYNGMVSDFNDGTNKSTALALRYIDPEAFKLLKHIDEKWNNIDVFGKDILKYGYISDEMPLYRKSYDLIKKKYSEEKENELLYSLMVWENTIREGKSPEAINKWMDEQLKLYGCLYTKYDINTNKPVDYIESTSIYAVAYRISLKGDNKELQEKLYKSLMKYYMDEGDLKGGFGMEKSKEAYSFDNIEAMISLLEEKGK